MPELNSPDTSLVSDPAIPTLNKVFDPVALRASLVNLSSPAWGTIRNIGLQVLKHHLGLRCTFEINLQTTRGCHSLIGKVYATDRADIYEAMERIWRAGFSSDQEFSIPRPRGYVPELRLLLQEKVEGIRTKEVFLKGSDRDRVATAERCARWLARFHAVAPKAGPVFGIEKYLATLKLWSRHISDVSEPLREKAACLFDRLAVAATGLRPTQRCAGHGSYSYAQILLADGVRLNGLKDHTITFDWDGYDVADSCRDVARFTVHLRRLALSQLGSIRALDRYSEVFQQAYVAARESDCLANLTFYQAAICLQFCEYLVRRQIRQLEKIEAILDEGLRILDQGAN